MVEKEIIKLDLRDRKILFELDFRAREPNSGIARKVGLSKQGVDYRIRRLQEKGVIEGFYPVINIIKLGYVYGRILLKFQNVNREKEREIFSALISDTQFRWIVSAEGNYDLGVAVWAKRLTDLKNVSGQLLERFGQFIREKRESVGIRVTHFQGRYLIGAAAAREVSVEEGSSAGIDEVDVKILRALCKNARMPLVELAKNAVVSPKVAAYRLRRLESEGVILGYRPSINHNLLGFTHYKILFYLSNVTKLELRRFHARLRQLPEVLYIVEEIGICDVDIEVMLPSAQSLFSFIDQIKFDFPTLIRDYQILILKKTLKIDYLPF